MLAGVARLFVAVVPPGEVVASLTASVAPLRLAHPALRWVDPERWHITLAFLGGVPDGARADLDARLGRVARRHPPVDVALAVPGRFGHRVLWISVHGRLTPLILGVRRAALRAGAPPPDDRSPRAHLTLARVPDKPDKPAADLRPLVDALAGIASPSWRVAEIELVSSVLGPHPRYRTEARWALTGRVR
jgi:2'-5' RNA ligase